METKSKAVEKLDASTIFWLPSNPQGDIRGTKKDTKEILDLAKACKERCSLLIDLSKAEMPNLEQKKAVAKAGQKYKFHKIAVYGYSWRMKLVVDFVVKLVGEINVELFKNREQALKWIREK